MKPTNKPKLPEHLGISWYELSEWLDSFGSMPVKRHRYKNLSKWELDQAHIFELESGKFAFVLEEGCSCYEPRYASIDVLPTLADAERKFREWEQIKRMP